YDRLYNIKDYDRNLVIDERTEIVAKRVTEFLNGTNRFDKTIVFCVDINHAQRMRQALFNENADLVVENHKYIMKITGDDEEGKRELDNFIDPEQRLPVIVTTSKLMTTGVDAQTCKVIVLESVIHSMTEFKQIIGRGTRIREDFGKNFFTIIDFRNVTELFADPKFDGEPVKIYTPKGDEGIVPDESEEQVVIIDGETGEEIFIEDETIIEREPRKKVYVNGVEVNILHERVQYLDEDGKLITQNLTDYTKQNVLARYRTLNDFLIKWNEVDKIHALVDELESQGVFFYELYESIDKDLDPFDLICHVAYGMPPLTRRERANNVKKRHYFAKYGEQARKVLESLLDKYADTGIETIESSKILEIDPIKRFGTPFEIIKMFGGVSQYKEAIRDLRLQLYITE
ncbi:MAG: type I restriction endonuclease, partial [Candidatus Marinimicrobia bacterium]|nr:type I restriction endonuclease [Candidatus Neomarinimicrobiota bacterium]